MNKSNYFALQTLILMVLLLLMVTPIGRVVMLVAVLYSAYQFIKWTKRETKRNKVLGEVAEKLDELFSGLESGLEVGISEAESRNIPVKSETAPKKRGRPFGSKTKKKVVKKKTKGGFTLIELLVVIAIAGILASIIIASLKHGRCLTNPDCKREQVVQEATNGVSQVDCQRIVRPEFHSKLCS